MDISEFQRANIIYGRRHPWEIVRAKIIFHLLKGYGKKFVHLLDVGSGDAYVLSRLCLNKIAENYTAVDTAYESDIIDHIVPNISCNISFVNHLPQHLSPDPDIVLVLDVLEHCEDDAAILQEVTEILQAKDYILIITVPAFQSLFSAHDKLLGHYRRYTVRQLRQLCKSKGLQVRESGYFFFSLTLVRFVQLFLEKIGIRNPKKTIENWESKKWSTRLWSSLLWFDYKIGRFFLMLGLRFPGLSAYCICHPLP